MSGAGRCGPFHPHSSCSQTYIPPSFCFHQQHWWSSRYPWQWPHSRSSQSGGCERPHLTSPCHRWLQSLHPQQFHQSRPGHRQSRTWPCLHQGGKEHPWLWSAWTSHWCGHNHRVLLLLCQQLQHSPHHQDRSWRYPWWHRPMPSVHCALLVQWRAENLQSQCVHGPRMLRNNRMGKDHSRSSFSQVTRLTNWKCYLSAQSLKPNCLNSQVPAHQKVLAE